MPERRHFAFLGPYRAAIAMDIEILEMGPEVADNRSRLTFVLAFCCGKDQFEKRIARNILNGRLDTRLAGERIPQSFQIEYEGMTPRRDVMYPLMDIMRETLPADTEETPSAARKRSWKTVDRCRNQILLAAAGRRVPSIAEIREAANAARRDSLGLRSDPELREAAEQISGTSILSVEESC